MPVPKTSYASISEHMKHILKECHGTTLSYGVFFLWILPKQGSISVGLHGTDMAFGAGGRGVALRAGPGARAIGSTIVAGPLTIRRDWLGQWRDVTWIQDECCDSQLHGPALGSKYYNVCTILLPSVDGYMAQLSMSIWHIWYI